MLSTFFGSFFGSSNHDKRHTEDMASAVAALDIQVAISAHENWKYRLQTFLDGTSKEVFSAEQICFDDRCDLGKWIHTAGKAKLGQYPGFTALMGHHKMFHYAASNVVSLAQAGKDKDAAKMLGGQFESFSSAVVSDLNNLRSLLEGAKKRR